MPMTEPISRSMPSAFEKSHLGSANKSIFPTAFCASAQANIACASFTARQATASTPLAFSLSNFSTKSITHPKTQEVNSNILIGCFKNFFLNIYRSSNEVFKNTKKQICEGRKLKSISDELYKRLILPLYTLVISLIAASLIIEPKSKYFLKFHKINIFLIGSFIIIVSQISLKFLLNSISMVYLVSLLPVIFLLLFYLLLFLSYKFKLNYL